MAHIGDPGIVSQSALGSGAAGAGGAASGFAGLGAFGSILSISGMLTGAIGSFYSAKSQQYSLRSQALSLEFERSIANLNARAAEEDAQFVLRAGQQEAALRTLQFGQIRGTATAEQAARGVQAGVGSAAEVLASVELAKEVDVLTINANAVRQAQAARRQAVNQQTRSILAGVSAQNFRGAAGSISPLLSGFTSLLGGAGQVAGNFASNRRDQILAQSLRRS